MEVKQVVQGMYLMLNREMAESKLQIPSPNVDGFTGKIVDAEFIDYLRQYYIICLVENLVSN